MASRVMSGVDGMRKGSQFHVTITAETHTPVHRKPCLINIDNWQIYSPRGKRPGVECPTIWNVNRDKAAVSYFCLLERSRPPEAAGNGEFGLGKSGTSLFLPLSSTEGRGPLIRGSYCYSMSVALPPTLRPVGSIHYRRAATP